MDTLTLAGFKQLLRDNDIKGDAWGVSMGAFFDLCAIAYERLYSLPSEWGYQPGCMGNTIDEDNIFNGYEISDDTLLEIGNYLFKLTNILKAANLDY